MRGNPNPPRKILSYYYSMKTQRLLFLAGLALASLSALSARDTTPAEKGDYEGWFNYYYKHPQPEYLLKATYQLNRQGFFDDGQSSVAMGFYATIFAQNPGKVDEWFANFRAMPMNVQRLMASALYLSGDRRGPQYLTRVANLAAPDSRFVPRDRSRCSGCKDPRCAGIHPDRFVDQRSGPLVSGGQWCFTRSRAGNLQRTAQSSAE